MNTITQVTAPTSRMAALFAIIQDEHLLYPEELNQEYYHDVVDRSIRAGEIDAELGKDSSLDSMPLMPEEEFKQLLQESLQAVRNKHKLPKMEYDLQRGEFRAPVVEPKVEVGHLSDGTVVETVNALDFFDYMAMKSDHLQTKSTAPLTEMSLGQPRVLDTVDLPIQPLNEFHQHVLEATDRPVVGGCIPSVTWSEMDNIIAYLDSFKEVVSRVPDEKLDKPSWTKEMIEADIQAEYESKIFTQMSVKIKRRLLRDGQLDLETTRRLNEVGYTVSHVPTLGVLQIEITKDFKLSWPI